MTGDPEIERLEDVIGALMTAQLRGKRMCRQSRSLGEQLVGGALADIAERKLHEMSDRRAELIVRQEKELEGMSSQTT